MRGQAAIEYLTTYGWAILSLLLVIGFLFTSGVLSPTYLIDDECDFGTNFKCNAILFNQQDYTNLSFQLYNGFPYPVNITKIKIEGKTVEINDDRTLNSGSNKTYSVKLNQSSPGTIKQLSGVITYRLCPEKCGPNHNATGRVIGEVIQQ